MAPCNHCDAGSLLADFCTDEKVCDIQTAVLAGYVHRVHAYAQQAGKMLCGMRMEDMAAYVKHLYSLENAAYTQEDSSREIYIMTLFYDFLVSRGCLAGNPLRELKAAAVRQLLDKLRGGD